MLGYERIGQLVAVSATSKTTIDLSINKEEISISFLDYVRSQVHLNIADDLYHRPFHEYADTLRYLTNGYSMYLETAQKVLRYFYSDMASFLIRNPYNVKMFVCVNAELDLPETKIDVVKVKKDLQEMASADSVEELASFAYPEILDFVKSKDDLLAKIDSYSVAAVLNKFAKQKRLTKLILEGEVMK